MADTDAKDRHADGARATVNWSGNPRDDLDEVPVRVT